MKSNTLLLIVILILIGCRNKSNNKVDNSGRETYDSCVTISSHPQTDSIEEILHYMNEEASGIYKSFKIFSLEQFMTEDFNGDNVIDKAVFVKDNKTSGIIIIDGKTKEKIKLGFNLSFADSIDFNWATYWGILKDPKTVEIYFKDDEMLDSLVVLNNPSIFVMEYEVGGGVITFKDGKYLWIHQSD